MQTNQINTYAKQSIDSMHTQNDNTVILENSRKKIIIIRLKDQKKQPSQQRIEERSETMSCILKTATSSLRDIGKKQYGDNIFCRASKLSDFLEEEICLLRLTAKVKEVVQEKNISIFRQYEF